MTYTCTTSPVTTPTLADIQRVVETLEEFKRQGDPIALWMAEQGFAPERGGKLILPATMRDEMGPFPPKYVRFSTVLKSPALARF